MATLEMNKVYTLLELMLRGQNARSNVPLQLVEPLVVHNEIFLDATHIECNDGTGYIGAQRTTLPTPSARRYNRGTSPTMSQTRPFTESTVAYEDRSEVDIKILERAGANAGAARSQEDTAHVLGFGNHFGEMAIYGAEANPEEFQGLAPRLNDLSFGNVWGSGGTGSDLSSIYIVAWGPQAATFVYPQGSPPGLTMRDLGEESVLDGDNKPYRAMVSLFNQDIGFAVHNFEHDIARVCNIETTGSSNIFDEDILIQALNHMRGTMGSPVILVNETIMSQMDIAAKDKTNVSYTSAEVYGHPTTLFRGVPVRRNDAILITEDAIT